MFLFFIEAVLLLYISRSVAAFFSCGWTDFLTKQIEDEGFCFGRGRGDEGRRGIRDEIIKMNERERRVFVYILECCVYPKLIFATR